jgi:hypothetical protein
MGAIEFAEIDSEAVLEQDQRVAKEFDAGRFVREALPTEPRSLPFKGRVGWGWGVCEVICADQEISCLWWSKCAWSFNSIL